MFGRYPITSLKRDNARSARWLALLAVGLRARDRAFRAGAVEAGQADPGPGYAEEMAVEVDALFAAYRAREYDQANARLKRVSNWVARMGDDRDHTPPEVVVAQQRERAYLIQFWKEAWKIAEHDASARQWVDSGLESIRQWDELLAPTGAATGPTVVAFCPTCGQRRVTGARYCTACGKDLAAVETNVEPPPRALEGPPSMAIPGEEPSDPPMAPPGFVETRQRMIGTWLVRESSNPSLSVGTTATLLADESTLIIEPQDGEQIRVAIDQLQAEAVDDMWLRVSDDDGPLATLDWMSGPNARQVAREIQSPPASPSSGG